MAKAKKTKFAPSFNYGANRKKSKRKKGGSGKKSNAWRAYVGGGKDYGPIPD